MITLKTACVYGDADVVQIIASDDDIMLVVGYIWRVEYPPYMGEPTVWTAEVLGIGGDRAFQTFDAALDHAKSRMDDIRKAFYAR